MKPATLQISTWPHVITIKITDGLGGECTFELAQPTPVRAAFSLAWLLVKAAIATWFTR